MTYKQFMTVIAIIFMAMNIAYANNNLSKADAQYQLGLLYLQGDEDTKKDEQKAFELFKSAAMQNHEKAQLFVAMMYDDAIGVEKDEDKALEYYKLSSENGDHRASFNLGMRYLDGEKVNADHKQSIKYFGLSARQGNEDATDMLNGFYEIFTTKLNKKFPKDTTLNKNSQEALYDLAMIYFHGDGVDKDKDKAIALLELADKYGYANASIKLGEMYLYGINLVQDEKKGIRLLEKGIANDSEHAITLLEEYLIFKQTKEKLSSHVSREDFQQTLKLAEQGDADAQYRTALLYEYAAGTKKDNAEIIKWMIKSADNGMAPAQSTLAEWYLYGHRYVDKNIDNAIKYFNMAADQGDRISQRELGKIYFFEESKKNIKKATDLLTLAAKGNDSEAQYMIGKMRVTGRHLPKDFDIAEKLLVASADQGDIDAQALLSILHFQGKEFVKDNQKAIYYGELAAKQNQPDAQLTLGMIYYFESDDSEKIKKEALKMFKLSADQGNEAAISIYNRLTKE